MRNDQKIRRALPMAVLAASAVATFVALGGVGGTVWGSGLKGRHRFIAIRSLPPPDFILRFYRDISGLGLPRAVGKAIDTPSVAIAEHTLTFHSGDPDELANVMIAVQNINGAVILPGATFSFNDTVGERTEERGFREGLMYMSGRLVSGIGGGVCIPSTALYNAALKADLEIVERYNHSGPVSYAEPGLDAAVAFGFKDFRFRNNTDGPLTIRASVLDDTLTVTLQARNATGRRVVLETVDRGRLDFAEEKVVDAEVPVGQPEVEQEGRAGYVVTVIRTVYQGDRMLRRETMSRDVVAARNRIVRVNPLDDPTSEEALEKAAELARAEELAKTGAPVDAEGMHSAVEPPQILEPAGPKDTTTGPVAAPKERREDIAATSMTAPKPSHDPKPTLRPTPKPASNLAPKPEPKALEKVEPEAAPRPHVEPAPRLEPAQTPAAVPVPSIAPPTAEVTPTEAP